MKKTTTEVGRCIMVATLLLVLTTENHTSQLEDLVPGLIIMATMETQDISLVTISKMSPVGCTGYPVCRDTKKTKTQPVAMKALLKQLVLQSVLELFYILNCKH